VAADASALVAAAARQPTLIVNRHHIARVSYTDRLGRRHRVLAWGAVGAIAPTTTRRQVRFRFDFSGGYGSFGAGYWRRMRNTCRPYSGPALVHVVAACTDTDGSFWALQTWERLLPDGGWPGTRRQRAPELHLSHWRGGLPRLMVLTDWAASGRYDHLFGRLTYAGHAVYGFGATSVGSPLDGFGRNVYVDVHDPPWGRGWYRFNSGLTHRPGGDFCFGMYALAGRTSPARGDAYRATVMGPGVTPIVRWTGPAPGAYNASLDATRNVQQQAIAPAGDSCNAVS
jgi:hypothetical protein